MREDLLKQKRRTREIKVEAGGRTFTARRPTDVEAARLFAGEFSFYDVARDFVTGWGDDFRECDFVRGGSSDPLAFDRVLWAEYLADEPDLWEPIKSAVINAYKSHVERRRSAEKN